MNDNFYKRLFAGEGEVEQAIHTAMTADLSYTAALYDKQPNSAFFYDEKHPPTFLHRHPNAGACVYPLKHNGRTHHAKLSLVKLKNGLRLAVYTRNLTFSKAMDTALLFDVIPIEQQNENAEQLLAYLNTVQELSGAKRDCFSAVIKWLKNKSIRLRSEFEKDADIFFGGCGGKTLAARLDLANAKEEDSIVLTPPAFIQGTEAKEYFGKKGILYDNTNHPSHVKLYLLHHDSGYTLWIGSANATVQGIGWNFRLPNSYLPPEKCSIECLVRFKLTEEKFAAMKRELADRGYIKFDFDFDNPNTKILKVSSDPVGQFICAYYECDAVSYSGALRRGQQGTVHVSLRRKHGDSPQITAPATVKWLKWRPAEYDDMAETPLSGCWPDKIELEYSYASFRKSYGILLFGKSCSAMIIPDELLRGIPRADGREQFDTLLTDWMCSGLPEQPDSRWPKELADMYGLLNGSAIPQEQIQQKTQQAACNAVCRIPKELEQSAFSPKPMPFQKNAAYRLHNILQKYSRAFLADEPGLGKTFTSAFLLVMLARDAWKNNKEPFFAIYLAPNQLLLSKNGQELVDKASTFLQEDEGIVLLNQKYNNQMPDRPAFACEPCAIRRKCYQGKKVIILLTFSANTVIPQRTLLKLDHERKLMYASSEAENAILRAAKKTAFEYAYAFLEEFQFGLLIWDEYHRYIGKLLNKITATAYDNPFFCYEKRSAMKQLFVSATPYNTRISGEDNKEALEQLYQAAFDDQNDELTALPSFETEFAELFCGGKPQVDIIKMIDEYKNNKLKDLEKTLRLRMVRNERTRLQGEYEPFRRITAPASGSSAAEAVVLRNTFRQCEQMGQIGFSDSALHLSMLMPWIMSFPHISSDKSYKILSPPQGQSIPKSLLAYEEGAIKHCFPEQSLAFRQICTTNLPDRQAAQLLWMPPTVPDYDPGENSIFSKHKDYSKLLVFAEFSFLQRGGAAMLSDYCRFLCKTEKPVPNDFLQVLPTDSFSPYDCAEKLGLDKLDKEMPQNIQNAFLEYFKNHRQILWSWMCDNQFMDKEKWGAGVLEYCRQGNLRAVLEEFFFCTDGGTKQLHSCEMLCDLLTRSGCIVKYSDNQTKHNCEFADRLTDDVGDVGTGVKKTGSQQFTPTELTGKAFNSPFYPMIVFAGRGAQEGIDLHYYCQRIMHLTLPLGAVSYEQRNGRIDRFRSLLIRRRAAEYYGGGDGKPDALARMFAGLIARRDQFAPNNQLFPNWSIPNKNSRWHFEEMIPVWLFSEENKRLIALDKMLQSYRSSIGSHQSLAGINLSTMESLTENVQKEEESE